MSSSTKSLEQDTRGAILVVGILLGAILVGAVFHIASMGDAILWREDVQNAVDAGAFEHAVWSARGMNFIVAVNIVMSLVLAVLVIWRVVMIAIGAIALILCLTGVGCAAGGPLFSIEAQMLRLDPQVSTNILRVLSAMNVVEMAIASATPVVAIAGAAVNTSGAHGVAPLTYSTQLIPSLNRQGIENARQCLSGGRGGGGRGGAGQPALPGGSNRPALPPGSNRPALPPGSNPPALPPGSNRPALPPGSNRPALPPGSNPPALPPGANRPALPPGSNRPALPPGSNPPALPPGANRPALPPGPNRPALPPGPNRPALPPGPNRPALPPGANRPALPAGSQRPGPRAQRGGSGNSGSRQRSGGGNGGSFNGSDLLSWRMGMPVSLPVQDDSFSLLCNKAASFSSNNLNGLIERGLMALGVSERDASIAVLPFDLGRNVIGFIAGLTPGIFCAPFGSAPFSMDGLADVAGQTACRGEFDDLRRANGGRSSDPRTLDAYPNPDGVFMTEGDWIRDCEQRKQRIADQRTSGGAAAPLFEELNCGKPAKVWDYAVNGNLFMRSFGRVSMPADTSLTDGVLDAVDGTRTGNVSGVETEPVAAHAEMYFDCEGNWFACGRDAMWQLRWRARLRRVQSLDNLATDAASSVLGGMLGQFYLSGATQLRDWRGWGTRLGLSPADNQLVDYIVTQISGRIGNFVLGANADSADSAFESMFDGVGAAVPISDVAGSLGVETRAPAGEADGLRTFIRENGGRSATIH